MDKNYDPGISFDLSPFGSLWRMEIPAIQQVEMQPVVPRDQGDSFRDGWNSAMALMHTMTRQPRPERVIFNDPATIVYWNDGTKTVVKCQPGDTFSAETGLMAAMLKRYMGNNNTYNKELNKWLPPDVPALPAAIPEPSDSGNDG